MPEPAHANPLLSIQFPVPFDRVRTPDIEPAIARLLEDARSRRAAIGSDPSPRTFANTMLALDELAEPLDYAMGIVRHLESVATTPELRSAFNAVQPPVSAFFTGIPLDEGLWKGIQAYAASPEAALLEGARRRFLQKTVEAFRRHGAGLDPAGKKRLEELDVELTQITTRFAENVLDSTNAFELVIEDEADLAGLPPAAVAAARESAARKGREGWRFTLQAPDYFAVMTYLDNAAIRRRVYEAYSVRGTEGPWDNRPLIRRILELRAEKARLLGFRDFADLVLEDRMAHDGARAMAFLEDLKAKTEARFHQENRELLEFRRSLEGPGAPELAPWDVSYYAEKQRAALYDFDEEALRPYFPLESVDSRPVRAGRPALRRAGGGRAGRAGVGCRGPLLRHARRERRFAGRLLRGLVSAREQARRRVDGRADHRRPVRQRLPPAPRLHLRQPDASPGGEAGAADASRGGDHLPRVRPPAAPHVQPGGDPHAGGFQRGLGFRGASLADHGELVLGARRAGYVRPPLGDRRADTRGPFPEDEAGAHLPRGQRADAAVGVRIRRPAAAYRLFAGARWRPGRYTRQIIQDFSPAPLPPDHAMIAGFTHLFADPVGYGAGYYSYKWAEVLDADAFTRFRVNGIFSRETGAEFRDKILAKGDSEDPAELYRQFMGRDPDPRALLERSGLA